MLVLLEVMKPYLLEHMALEESPHQLPFLENWLISTVLETTAWRSNSTFSSFYFKDIKYIFNDSFLGFFCGCR